MQSDLPVFSTDEEALSAAVAHSGGLKVIGVKLWPDLSPDVAARKLSDALNPNRAERLKPSQMRLVLREAHARGYHAAAQWIMGEVGYSVVVRDPVEQTDRAIEAVQQATDVLARSLSMLERAQRGAAYKVVA